MPYFIVGILLMTFFAMPLAVRSSGIVFTNQQIAIVSKMVDERISVSRRDMSPSEVVQLANIKQSIPASIDVCMSSHGGGHSDTATCIQIVVQFTLSRVDTVLQNSSQGR